MQVSRFTKTLASSVFALLLATSAYAARNDREVIPCPREEVCCEMPPAGPYGYNFPKDLGLACPSDFYFYIDYLLLQVKMEGLEYAVTNTSGLLDTVGNNGFPLTGGEVLGFSSDQHDWKWGSGFRVGIGFYLSEDSWTIDMDWLYYKKSQEVSSSITNSGVLVPIWIKPPEETAIANATNVLASARWRVSINELDISLGKPYMVSPYFTLQPYFGLRGAWIDQRYVARYGGDIVLSGTAAAFQGAQFDADHEYWGFGARAGLCSDFCFDGGWGLHGNVAFSMLYSKYSVFEQMPLGALSYEFNHRFYTNVPVMDLQLGISWGTYLNHHRHHFTIQGMYEFQQWWNHNQLRRLYCADSVSANDTVARGDLSFNGLSLRLLFDF